jgi:hypothetical protein
VVEVTVGSPTEKETSDKAEVTLDKIAGILGATRNVERRG